MVNFALKSCDGFCGLFYPIIFFVKLKCNVLEGKQSTLLMFV